VSPPDLGRYADALDWLRAADGRDDLSERYARVGQDAIQ